jgi:hypothetical protein
MGQAITRQHPSVVLRSHFNLVRALLGVAMVAVVALTIAVVILANESNEVAGTTAAKPVETIRYSGFNPVAENPEALSARKLDGSVDQPSLVGQPRYDGGPEEGTRGPSAAAPAPDTRYDGGPEEGSRGPGASTD